MYLERLLKESQSKNRKGVKVILTMSTKEEADRLVKNGLNFKYIRKSVLYFWEADPRAICYKYCRIGYEKPKICGDRLFIYKIYGRDYYTNKYIYNILIHKARKGKRCLYELVKCGNYTSINWKNKHRALSPSCRYKKIIITILAGKRFERKKNNDIII